MYNEVITLIKTVKSVNVIGDPKIDEIKREVFAEIKSVGQQEFYQAQAQGLKPEMKVILSDYYDYEDEEELIYSDKRYKVLRTYRNGTQLEITCYGGVNIASTKVGSEDK